MSLLKKAPLILALVLSIFAATAANADQLADVKKAGVLRVAVIDQNPPFGLIDEKTKETVGYDVDFANLIAAKIGVKLQIVGTNPANRIPLLQSGKVDLIVGDLTNTAERAKVIDFSDTYFVTGQQILVPAASSDKLADYATSRIGAVKGTTGENQLKAKFPNVKAISFDDIPLAFAALRAGNVQAITQDGSILIDALARSPDKAKFKILPDYLSTELIGIGVSKNQKALLDLVNDVLVTSEKDGSAAKIYNKWFGSGALVNVPRGFKIEAGK
jgi:polar amino acid transport system substrate-binding protein